MKLSAVIITLNEEHNIERCINSVRDIADEILIVDSGSTDYTVGIAHLLGAKVIVHSFQDYVAQKNFAVSQASNDWILSIDADEEISAQLRLSIRVIKSGAEHDCYSCSRLSNYCGKWIRHCGWYPDQKIRLFNRSKGKWWGKKIHEQWRPHNADGRIGSLDGDLLHYTISSREEHLKKVKLYTDLLAEVNFELGKRPSLLKVHLGPVVNFIGAYFFRMGFLDGASGFQLCRISAIANYLKHKKTRQQFLIVRNKSLAYSPTQRL